MVALLVTRDLIEYRGLERQIQQGADDLARERAEFEAQIQSVEERAAEHARDGVASEDVRASADVEAQLQAAEDRVRAALAERDA